MVTLPAAFPHILKVVQRLAAFSQILILVQGLALWHTMGKNTSQKKYEAAVHGSCPNLTYSSVPKSSISEINSELNFSYKRALTTETNPFLEGDKYINQNNFLPCAITRFLGVTHNISANLEQFKCTLVVVTALFGPHDVLKQAPETKDVCFVSFMDICAYARHCQLTLEDPCLRISGWSLVLVRHAYVDARVASRLFKLHLPALFPQCRWSIWVDAKTELVANPWSLLKLFLWPQHADVAFPAHPVRASSYDEQWAVLLRRKADLESTSTQRVEYREAGVPDISDWLKENL
eukprot:CAMPEP_0202347376 /NCGR_PEP_ID=MMETSP1126-20121109/5764_1 /ASSEMBLY_ACC=CAM_ASM_000457 /TAXON_ID=3047 /ORGANISM="Dunaliella tertiolecta, Strain CCMP1320" /LENGTH=291 /DNA_ID=CAMNT_0048938917 /DNA_START=287 /DNA_END=1163 /DNA_ORIENTATION=-